MTKTYTVKQGTKGWFERPLELQGGVTVDVAEFAQEQDIELAPYKESWLQTTGPVRGFPTGHPPILLHKNDVQVVV